MREPRVPAVVIGGSGAGLGLVRSLARANVPVVVLDTDRNQPAMHSRYARRVIVRALDGRLLIEDLLVLATTLAGPAVLFLTTDEQVLTVSEFRSSLEGAYCCRLPQHQRILTLISKTGFKNFSERHGFPVPQSATITQIADLEQLSDLSYPCIVKPAIKNTEYIARQFPRAYKVASKADAATICRKVLPVVPELVVQEWIEGPDSEIYFCLQYRAVDGKTVCSFTGRKLDIWPPDVGVTVTCTAAPEARSLLQPLTESFFQAASFFGMGAMEFKRDTRTGRFLLIEPTVGRVDLQEEVATLHGTNIPLSAYLHEVGLEVPPAEEYTAAVAWRGSWSHRTRAHGPHAAKAGKPFKRYDAYWRIYDPMPAAFHAVILLRRMIRQTAKYFQMTLRSIIPSDRCGPTGSL